MSKNNSRLNTDPNYLIKKFNEILSDLNKLNPPKDSIEKILLEFSSNNEFTLIEISKRIRNLLNAGYVDGSKRSELFTLEGGRFYQGLQHKIFPSNQKMTESELRFVEHVNWHKMKVREYVDELKLYSEIFGTSKINDMSEDSLDIDSLNDNFQGLINVFISHKFIKRDQELALKTRNILREKEIDGYLAEGIKEYELLIGDKIRKRIENSNYVIGIITSDSVKSPSVNQELGYALGINIPVLLLVEKGIEHGVLTHGRDIEEFTLDNFEKKCTNIRDYILEKGKKVKNPNIDNEWLIPNVYEPVYNQLMTFVENKSNLELIPPNPWKELSPRAKLKSEPEVAQLLQNYEKELEKWKLMFFEIKEDFTINQRQLGEIIKPVFEKAGMIHQDGQVILSESARQEPRHWIDVFKFILFDDTVERGDILYQKLMKYSRDSNNGMLQYLEYWNQHFPNIFEELVEIIPSLQKNLKINVVHSDLMKQREYLLGIIQKIIPVLEEKLK